MLHSRVTGIYALKICINVMIGEILNKSDFIRAGTEGSRA